MRKTNGGHSYHEWPAAGDWDGRQDFPSEWPAPLSAVAGAAACAVLFAVVCPHKGALAGLAAALCLVFSPGFWAVSQVAEMYSLWVLSAVALIALAARLSEDPSERPGSRPRGIPEKGLLAGRFAGND